jgi:hypothetical protein
VQTRALRSFALTKRYDLLPGMRVPNPLYPMMRGNQSTVCGMRMITARTTIATKMNGVASRTIAQRLLGHVCGGEEQQSKRGRDAARHRHAFIAGDRGSISTTYFNDTSSAFPPLLEVKRGTGWDAQREIIETSSGNGFLAEAESFHDLVRHDWDQWVGATPDESIDIALMLDALAVSARTGTSTHVVA